MLETDELHVPSVMRAVRPVALVLLNLSRDQLDRTHEVRRAAELWRAAIAEATQPLTVVANAADPNIAYAALDGARATTTIVWVDGGLQWFGDAELCPRCGELLEVDDDGLALHVRSRAAGGRLPRHAPRAVRPRRGRRAARPAAGPRLDARPFPAAPRSRSPRRFPARRTSATRRSPSRRRPSSASRPRSPPSG